MDKPPVFDADIVPTVEVEDHVESSEGHMNTSGDSAISATSSVLSSLDLPADIVSFCSFSLVVPLCQCCPVFGWLHIDHLGEL